MSSLVRRFGLCAALLISITAAAAQKTASPRPNYNWLRYEENWAFLRSAPAAQRTDFWDPVKYIPLGPTAWASLGGSTRLSYEQHDHFRFGTTPAADDDFILSRLCLHGDLHVNENVRAFVEVKSAGSTTRTLPGGRRPSDVDSFDFERGFLEFSTKLDSTRFTLRAGRQGLLVKRRLVHTPRWPNTNRRWDGFDLLVDHGPWTVHNFFVENVPTLKYDSNRADPNDKFFGSYAIRKGSKPGDLLELYALGLDRKNSRFNGTLGADTRTTLGAHSTGSHAIPNAFIFDWDFEGARQFGTVGAAKVSAWTFFGELGLPLKSVPLTPRFFAGFDGASGDNVPGGDVQTFNGLFADGHASFGYIDLIGRSNILDWFVGTSFQPFAKTNVRFSAHAFSRDSNRDAVYDASGAVFRSSATVTDRQVGTEVDITLNYQYSRHLMLEAGFSRFNAGDFIRRTGPAGNPRFVYLQIEYTF